MIVFITVRNCQLFLIVSGKEQTTNSCRALIGYFDSPPEVQNVGNKKPLCKHGGPTQAASLFVCSKSKEMCGRIILKSLIVNLYLGMSIFQIKINVNLPQL